MNQQTRQQRSRRREVERCHESFRTHENPTETVSESVARALGEAERLYVRRGCRWSTNGYLVGVSAAEEIAGKFRPAIVYVLDEGIGQILRRTDDGETWVVDLIGREGADGPVLIERIDEPTWGGTRTDALEAAFDMYDPAQDQRRSVRP
jgi:hypothetical protein